MKTADKKHTKIFDFKKENGKWKSYISAELAFEFQTRYGLPVENMEDYINNLPKEEKLNLMLQDWEIFRRNNPNIA